MPIIEEGRRIRERQEEEQREQPEETDSKDPGIEADEIVKEYRESGEA
jgi:hypothetical protein